MNYIVENRAILWWGGLGNSTEHTAYLRLKHGIAAPESGSIARNGLVVAEQIGAQIFIDGWALVASPIARLVGDIREWHAGDGDWRTTRARIAAQYGYDRYAGNCHIIPNHALIILAGRVNLRGWT